ncbi:MAG: hypothetical protein M1823_005592 [Watsoniomyces obsoletus]|nr:MAG: hypothetical protein M1823_005592 [Watsoniomyces obsoletus]
MDPFSITVGAITLAHICAKIVKTLHTTLESIQDAPEAVHTLLGRCRALQITLGRVDVLSTQLDQNRRSFLDSQIDGKRCKDTIESLEGLVISVGTVKEGFGHSFGAKMAWIRKEKEALKLAGHLERERNDIAFAMGMITVEIAVMTEKHLEKALEDRKSKEKEVIVAPQQQQLTLEVRPRNPFLHEKESTSSAGDGDGGVRGATDLVWLGEVYGDHLSSRYWSLRQELADAAHIGDWKAVFNVLGLARYMYNQPWINCTRLQRCKSSWWRRIPSSLSLTVALPPPSGSA